MKNSTRQAAAPPWRSHKGERSVQQRLVLVSETSAVSISLGFKSRRPHCLDFHQLTWSGSRGRMLPGPTMLSSRTRHHALVTVMVAMVMHVVLLHVPLAQCAPGAQSVSKSGIELIKRFQPLSLRPRKDFHLDIWTVGYGHPTQDTARWWTEAEAQRVFLDDVATITAKLRRHLKKPIRQNQFDALASFVFGIYPVDLTMTTLFLLINSGQLAAVPELIRGSNHVMYKRRRLFLVKLMVRRCAEAYLWTTGRELPKMSRGSAKTCPSVTRRLRPTGNMKPPPRRPPHHSQGIKSTDYAGKFSFPGSRGHSVDYAGVHSFPSYLPSTRPTNPRSAASAAWVKSWRTTPVAKDPVGSWRAHPNARLRASYRTARPAAPYHTERPAAPYHTERPAAPYPTARPNVRRHTARRVYQTAKPWMPVIGTARRRHMHKLQLSRPSARLTYRRGSGVSRKTIPTAKPMFLGTFQSVTPRVTTHQPSPRLPPISSPRAVHTTPKGTTKQPTKTTTKQPPKTTTKQPSNTTTKQPSNTTEASSHAPSPSTAKSASSATATLPTPGTSSAITVTARTTKLPAKRNQIPKPRVLTSNYKYRSAYYPNGDLPRHHKRPATSKLMLRLPPMTTFPNFKGTPRFPVYSALRARHALLDFRRRAVHSHRVANIQGRRARTSVNAGTRREPATD